MTKAQKETLERLEQVYFDARPGLDFNNAYELLIATILSAQCTDVRVNKVTKVLFSKYPSPKELSTANFEEVSDTIHSCGCYAVKAKNIIGTAELLMKNYNGTVPSTMEELTVLPGVGRKTANVVLSNAFDIPAIAVDTHVFRVSNRLGLAKANTVEVCEDQLRAVIPEKNWGRAHHWLITHGRKICQARSPKCADCFLSDICAFYQSERKDK